MQLEEFRTVLGTFKDSKIITEDEIIFARAYAAKRNKWNNLYGFFQLKYNNDFGYYIVCNYVPFDE